MTVHARITHAVSLERVGVRVHRIGMWLSCVWRRGGDWRLARREGLLAAPPPRPAVGSAPRWWKDITHMRLLFGRLSSAGRGATWPVIRSCRTMCETHTFLFGWVLFAASFFESRDWHRLLGSPSAPGRPPTMTSTVGEVTHGISGLKVSANVDKENSAQQSSVRRHTALAPHASGAAARQACWALLRRGLA